LKGENKLTLARSKLWKGYAYCPDTGDLLREFSGVGIRKGKVGAVNGHGYLTFGHKYKNYSVGVVSFEIYHNKKVPKGKLVDHRDGDKTNNKILNLRAVTYRVNNQNKKTHRNGRLVGCYFDNQYLKYRARISIKGKSKHLGLFETELEGHLAYLKAFKELKE